MKQACIYFITNKHNTVIYIGVTSNLSKRVHQHKNKTFPNSFSAKYNCNKLVYFEFFETMVEAITREKQLKAGNRKKKEQLINSINPNWDDLTDTIML